MLFASTSPDNCERLQLHDPGNDAPLSDDPFVKLPAVAA